MILVADSGATKTDWRGISSEGEITQYQSPGINPYLRKPAEIKEELLLMIKPQIGQVQQLFFYGAGCASSENAVMLKNLFGEVFPEAQINVAHDLLGAARSLCGNQPGIACILGTGANSCYYNGQDIIENAPNLGYVLGDEGSGAWMGKQLIAHFIRGELPAEVSQRLTKRFDLSRDIILENVYQKPAPSKYLAGFSKFIFQNIKEPFLYRLVYQGFEQFFEKNIERYSNARELPVHFSGSVAFYYSNILRQVANDKGVFVKNIVESPIAGLTLYHQTH